MGEQPPLIINTHAHHFILMATRIVTATTAVDQVTTRFVWNIDNYRALDSKHGVVTTSPRFLVDDFPFVLRLYPGGLHSLPTPSNTCSPVVVAAPAAGGAAAGAAAVAPPEACEGHGSVSLFLAHDMGLEPFERAVRVGFDVSMYLPDDNDRLVSHGRTSTTFDSTGDSGWGFYSFCSLGDDAIATAQCIRLVADVCVYSSPKSRVSRRATTAVDAKLLLAAYQNDMLSLLMTAGPAGKTSHDGALNADDMQQQQQQQQSSSVADGLLVLALSECATDGISTSVTGVVAQNGGGGKEAKPAGAEVEIVAHKMLLAAHSPYFKTLLGSNMVESKTGRIDLVDVSLSVIREVLSYVYTGKCSAALEDLDTSGRSAGAGAGTAFAKKRTTADGGGGRGSGAGGAGGAGAGAGSGSGVSSAAGARSSESKSAFVSLDGDEQEERAGAAASAAAESRKPPRMTVGDLFASAFVPLSDHDKSVLLLEVLATAHRFQMQPLQNWCATHLAHVLTTDILALTLIVADRFGLVDLKDACMSFLAEESKRLSAVMETEAFAHVDKELLHEVLGVYASERDASGKRKALSDPPSSSSAVAPPAHKRQRTEHAGDTSLTSTQVRQMCANALKNELAARGLDVHGVKPVLRDRLLAHVKYN